MGLWDKIKQAKNFVTGGGADVSMNFDSAEVKLGESFKVTVTAVVKDTPLKMDKAYLKIRARETVEAKDRDHHNGKSTTENVRNSVNTWTHEMSITGAEQLEANESYTWEASVEIPASNNPTYRGRNAWHEYEVFAGLDVPGNDPDSGWKQITVKG